MTVMEYDAETILIFAFKGLAWQVGSLPKGGSSPHAEDA